MNAITTRVIQLLHVSILPAPSNACALSALLVNLMKRDVEMLKSVKRRNNARKIWSAYLSPMENGNVLILVLNFHQNVDQELNAKCLGIKVYFNWLRQQFKARLLSKRFHSLTTFFFF